jgi:hypothetical protein
MICDDCVKKAVCKVTSPNMAGCIEYLPEHQVKVRFLRLVKKAKGLQP